MYYRPLTPDGQNITYFRQAGKIFSLILFFFYFAQVSPFVPCERLRFLWLRDKKMHLFFFFFLSLINIVHVYCLNAADITYMFHVNERERERERERENMLIMKASGPPRRNINVDNSCRHLYYYFYYYFYYYLLCGKMGVNFESKRTFLPNKSRCKSHLN